MRYTFLLSFLILMGCDAKVDRKKISDVNPKDDFAIRSQSVLCKELEGCNVCDLSDYKDEVTDSHSILPDYKFGNQWYVKLVELPRKYSDICVYATFLTLGSEKNTAGTYARCNSNSFGVIVVSSDKSIPLESAYIYS